MTNLCFIELMKNKAGLYYAGQSIYIASIRDYLKQNSVNSMIYTDESLPSLNDLAEDILSVVDDALVFYIDKDNYILVNALVKYIVSLESLPIYLISNNDIDNNLFDNLDVKIFTHKPEQHILIDLTNCNLHDCLDIMKCSPYENGTILIHDVLQYGILIGRYGKDGVNEYRNITTLKNEICRINEVYASTKIERNDFIKFNGVYISDSKYLENVLSILDEQDNNLNYVLPIDFRNFIENLSSIKNSSSSFYNIYINNEIQDEEQINDLVVLIDSNKVVEININVTIMINNKSLCEFLFDRIAKKKCQLKLFGEVDATKLSQKELNNVLKDTMLEYSTFSRGFLKSRTGMYFSVNLDGYVKHIEIDKDDYDSNIAKYLNEIACINSSVYIKNKNSEINNTIMKFNSDSIATLDNLTYKSYLNNVIENDSIPSNLITVNEGIVNINDMYYTARHRLIEITYKEAKQICSDIRSNFGQNDASMYVFSIEDEKDFELFLEDAETYNKTHNFDGLPLAFGYLKNYCRFMTPNYCYVDKLARIKIDSNKRIYTCSNKEEPIGNVGQSVFELTQNCYVKKEMEIKKRECTHCKARSWCSKCSQLPIFIKDKYCTIMKDKSYIIDYILSSVVYLQLVSTIPSFKNVAPEDIKVTSEYMFNMANEIEKGKEMPYLPKFTYMFEHNNKYVLWAIATNKFFNISKEYAYICELLFKHLSIPEIYKNFNKFMNSSNDVSDNAYNTIIETLNNSGILYRPIKEISNAK